MLTVDSETKPVVRSMPTEAGAVAEETVPGGHAVRVEEDKKGPTREE